MAYIRSRERSDGSTAHGVFFRDADTGRQTSKTFDDPNEADLLKRFLDANGQSFRVAEAAVVNMRSTSPTVSTALTHHIDHLTGVESGTIHRYRQLAKNHIAETLGPTPVDRLTRRQVLDWFEALPGAPKTRKNIHALLSAALETALDAGHIEANPAKGVRDSKVKSGTRKREPVFLSKDEVDAIVAAVNTRYALFVRTLAGSGLRWSEATALRKRDIKVSGGRAILRVRRAWKKTDQGIQIGGPKSPKSRRDVTLSASLSTAVIEHLKGKAADELVFTAPGGGRIPNNRFLEKHWTPTIAALLKSGALTDRPVVHDLRHTHVSLLVAAGVSLPVIQARLGHESISTTISVYSHLETTADAAAADLLD